eukprot:m.100970 g.100970  ORF g.100970 m.100970 type:complete len:466 (-) comp27292_c0_seq1:32-1429(-)
MSHFSSYLKVLGRKLFRPPILLTVLALMVIGAVFPDLETPRLFDYSTRTTQTSTTATTTTITTTTTTTTTTVTPPNNDAFWRTLTSCSHQPYVRLAGDCLGVTQAIADNKNFGSEQSTLLECEQACDNYSGDNTTVRCDGFTFLQDIGCWLKQGCIGSRGVGIGYKRVPKQEMTEFSTSKVLVIVHLRSKNIKKALQSWWLQMDSDWCILHHDLRTDSMPAQAVLEFIVKYYDNLPTTLAFAMGESSFQRDQVSKQLIFSTVPDNLTFSSIPAPFIRGHTAEQEPTEVLNFNTQLNVTKAMWLAALSAANLPLQPLYTKQTLYAGSQFVVARSAVLSRPKRLYEQLVESTPPHMDRVWFQLFTLKQIMSQEDHSRIQKWRTDALRHFCEPWNCSCAALYGLLGNNSPSNTDKDRGYFYWWSHGARTRYPYFFMEDRNSAFTEFFVKLFLKERKSPGYGPCTVPTW